MLRIRRVAPIIASIVGLAVLTACNFTPGIPVTPTLVPTLPPPPSALPSISTATVVALPSASFTPSGMPSATASLTPTHRPSAIPSLTLAATDTPTETVSPTVTFTDTETEVPTDTPQPTATLTPTLTDTAIPPTLVPTETLTVTPTALPTELSTALPTLVPTDVPSATIGPITATPLVTVTASITLVPAAGAITATALPTFTVPPDHIVNPTISAPTPHITPSPQVVAVSPAAPPETPVAGNADTPAAIAAVPTALSIFAPNGSVGTSLVFPPIDAGGNAVGDVDVSSKGSHAVIDASGHLTIDGSGYDGDGHKHARQIFKLARWSPDGNWLAYIVETPDAEADHLSEVLTNDDGVWVVQPGGTPIHVFLNVYQAGDAHFRVATGLAWSPDSAALIVTARIYQNDLASFLVGLGRNVQDDMALFADGGASWLTANQLVGVKSLGDPSVSLAILNRDGQPDSVIADGAALNLWMQDPARLPDGRYAFLGKPSATGRLENGPTQLSLYIVAAGSTTPVQVSSPIAEPIIAAEWNPADTILLVTVQTAQGVRTKAITLDGAITEIGPGGIHWKR